MRSRSVEYEEYIKSAKWRTISATMKKFANFVCQHCGKTFHPSELDVHHVNYERLGNERPSDLQILCRATCHPIADAKRVEVVHIRREERQYESAVDTYLSKKYGNNYAPLPMTACMKRLKGGYLKSAMASPAKIGDA